MIKKTLYFGNPAYLSLKDSQMQIRLPEVERSTSVNADFKKRAERTIPIEDIGIVLIDNKQITLTHGLLEMLLENNCAVITCDSRHMPVGMMLPLEGNTIQSERFKKQIDASIPLRKQLWQQTVQQKIANQAEALSRNSGYENKCLQKWSNDVRSGDPDNIEARAAAYYWKHFFPNVKNFVRDRDGDFPNNVLNYGYALLRAVIARGLVGSGLLPTLGIHHHNRYNAYCLADDIMEPYRPFVDELVFQIIREQGIIVDLTKEIKTKLLSIPILDVTISGKRSPLMIAVGQTTASLAKCFEGEMRKICYPTF